MTNVEVYLDWQGEIRKIGLLRRHPGRNRESVTFEYDPTWINSAGSFSMDPGLPVGPGIFRPSNQKMFGTLGDSAPDSWGRTLMRRNERRMAEREGRRVRTLQETDYLLGVADETRLGALRFRWEGDEEFQASQDAGVPTTVALGKLLGASQRILRGEESDEDLLMIFAPGSSLGGARPKASVMDQHGQLSIAKFPRETDEYSLERWEAIALELAKRAGIDVAVNQLLEHDGNPIFLSERFDRNESFRIPFVSAMAMTQHLDGERGSYLEIVDALTEHGASAPRDRRELYRRIAFSILVSNTDDHLRNHGFLWMGLDGWTLSPAYDVNPTPEDLKPRILATNIDYQDSTCSIELLRSVAEEFSLKISDADKIIYEVADITRNWREVAIKNHANKFEIQRMQSAFVHQELEDALKLG